MKEEEQRKKIRKAKKRRSRAMEHGGLNQL